MFRRVVTAPLSDPDLSSTRALQATRDAALRSALEHLEAVLQGSTAWRALQQLDERERNGEWLDVIESDLLRASLLEDLAREPTYLAWRDVSTALAEAEHARSLSGPHATTATAATRLPAVADRLPTVKPTHPPSSSSDLADAAHVARHSPAAPPKVFERAEPDRIAPAIAIGTGRLGSSDEAYVVIRRNQSPNTRMGHHPVAPGATESVDVPRSSQRHTLAHDDPDAIVAIIRRPTSERPISIAFDDHDEAPAMVGPDSAGPSDTNTEAEASVTILRNSASPPKSTGAPLSQDLPRRQPHRGDWYIGHLNIPAPRTGLRAFTQKLHRSWRRD